VQDYRIKFNKDWTCIRASDAQEKLKEYSRRSEKMSTEIQHHIS